MAHHPSRFRVLHLVASTDRRGAETAAVELANALEPVGVPGEVVALAAGHAGGLDLPVLGESRYAGATLRRLRARAGDVSILVAHGSSTLPAAAVATLGTGTPFVYRSIGDPQAWLTTPGRRRRVGLAARRAAGLVALWRGAAVTWHQLVGVRPERIAVIPNGVPVERFRPPDAEGVVAARAALSLPPSGPVIMYLGALSREKRVDLAIEVSASIEGATLAVVGDGPERDRLVPIARRAGDVRFLGPTAEPWRALAAADAVIVTSDTEGQPAAAIEAGLMGVPVVATRVGGVAEVVLDGVTGRLAEPGDVAGLTDGLRQVLHDPARYRSAAREHCLEQFGLDLVARKWGQFLQSVIKNTANPEQHSA